MIIAPLVMLVSLGGIDSLARASVQKLSFKAPTGWQKSAGDENSLSWEEPSSGASFAVSAYKVDPQRPARACLQQSIEALGGDEGFTTLMLGAQPAAKKVTTDFIGENEQAEKNDGSKVTTTTVLGCNGKVRWVLTWSSKTSHGARFGPMLKRVLESISYAK